MPSTTRIGPRTGSALLAVIFLYACANEPTVKVFDHEAVARPKERAATLDTPAPGSSPEPVEPESPAAKLLPTIKSQWTFKPHPIAFAVKWTFRFNVAPMTLPRTPPRGT